MPSIRTLKTFLAVSRYGTFAAAAKHIGLTPAAVGLQIRSLEEDLRCRLINRGARSATLSATGRSMLPEIEEIVGRYESLPNVAELPGLHGTVVMGALVSALMGAFSDALWTIKQQHPRLDVRLLAGFSSDFTHRVEIGELDAAAITQPPRTVSSGLVWTPLYSEPMVLVVPQRPHFALASDSDPIRILQTAPFLRFDHNAWTGLLVEEVIRRSGVRTQESMELNSVETIIELVRQGLGVSIVPKLANVAWEQDHSLRVLEFKGIDVARRVGLMERQQHRRMRFTEAIKDYFAQGGRRESPVT
ncbi:HTH-type transcriptional regulator CysL [compost metagenome]